MHVRTIVSKPTQSPLEVEDALLVDLVLFSKPGAPDTCMFCCIYFVSVAC